MPSFKVETITPSKAKALLARNTENRPLRNSRISQLSHAMKNGQWRMNGEAIKISAEGELLDGQHRLSAVIEADVKIDMMVVRDLDHDIFTTLDQGMKRTGGDILSLAGYTNAAALAAAARLAIIHKVTGSPFGNVLDGAEPTVDDVLEFVGANPYLGEATREVAKRKILSRMLTGRVAAFAWFHFGRVRPEETAEFFSSLASGAGLKDGSPILLLRNRLIAAQTGYEKLPPRFRSQLCAKAIRKYLSGDKTAVLRFRKNGKAEDEKKLWALDF